MTWGSQCLWVSIHFVSPGKGCWIIFHIVFLSFVFHIYWCVCLFTFYCYCSASANLFFIIYWCVCLPFIITVLLQLICFSSYFGMFVYLLSLLFCFSWFLLMNVVAATEMLPLHGSHWNNESKPNGICVLVKNVACGYMWEQHCFGPFYAAKEVWTSFYYYS